MIYPAARPADTAANTENAQPTEYQSILAHEEYMVSTVSFNKNLPEGYSIFLPYLELSGDELDRFEAKMSLPAEIILYKGEEEVGDVCIIPKRVYERGVSKAKELEQNSTPFKQIKIIKEKRNEELNYLLYSAKYDESLGGDFEDYLRFVGDFSQSKDTAFEITFFTTQKEAETLFEALNLQFLHE